AQTVGVTQSVWRGKIQAPKSEVGLRHCDLSPQLAAHLRGYLKRWRPNPCKLLFSTGNGTPWDANLLVKRKLRPLLTRLGISVPRGNGLHGFRHFNTTLMDRLGTPLKVRQQRLGHSSAKLTLDVYTHVVSEDGRHLAAQLGEILRPNVAKLEGQGPASIGQALVS
ncbi:MAG TPA: hypothetical protein VHM88_20510, partial [Candidatus Acidoferrales bacterium]|nr:hypothetical protein [Candidatus Acidoferrales bacterium]